MLAYRHAFHAGNHADVLKHLVLLLVLEHMNLKDKGYRVVDTHAGAGGYSLRGAYARKKGEFENGIGRLWSLNAQARAQAPLPVNHYLRLVEAFNGPRELDPLSATSEVDSPSHPPLKQYPGSPALAQAVKRPQDELNLFEMHPTDFRILSSWAQDERGVSCAMADGFAGLKSKLPPPTRRGVVLIDPPYELERDYGRVVATLREALERFSDGTYLIWYPQVSRVEAAQLPKRLSAVAPKGWLHARLTVQAPDKEGFGLMGSGMFVINPPYTLHGALSTLLPWLHAQLKQFDGGGWLLDQKAV